MAVNRDLISRIRQQNLERARRNKNAPGMVGDEARRVLRNERRGVRNMTRAEMIRRAQNQANNNRARQRAYQRGRRAAGVQGG